ncbi:hypothetical protein CONLIGDRAFT_633272 [Coniochaeta ligniaria NRRL 30616]|uniref:Ubiquitin-like domain-containing protein n=1 Tax=Coniochaeta ligniaria NRRL 30616 TaxID=1408157 RepID=A0A1J7JH75_9PEZI|nr:hypothetical protein CONLIGDRAFT_633272 [Coniochaeta ligniaria NRRL 30616]
MSAALTFGSVGDIIAVCGLAVELSKALSSARGSAKEYQVLRKDLDQFVQVLMQVIATYEQFEDSPSLESLRHVAKAVVDECGILIGEVLHELRERYGDSLQPGGSGNRVKDAYKKVEFSVRERDRVQLLQESLSKAIGRLGLLSSCAALCSARVDNSTLLLRIEEVKQQSAKHEHLESLAQAVSRLELLHQSDSLHQRQQLGRVEDELRQQHSGTTTILTSLGGLLSAILDVKRMLNNLGEAVAHMQILVTNQWFFRGPTGNILVFEDSFGRIDPFPTNWINSWEGLQTLMELRFKDTSGYDMVLQRQYVLEDDCNGKMIDTSVPFNDAIRVRKKVNMSMLFEADPPRSNTASPLKCPRCDLSATVKHGAVVKW